ncbi:hypothetical protein Hs30E_20420 [Lactococcus hodotermopsidis]|uniref:Sortase n=1 Tax=Pseudolactococcus hodotermopsidis TaxID=2709157 RepID=A0A6A0BFM4_9LACT|nr:sortase [Lactococcus hodotermopsidis]GFH43513.1 hypothetical protein Hs30E_20420 [Lactococcus hodotermopsidis]
MSKKKTSLFKIIIGLFFFWSGVGIGIYYYTTYTSADHFLEGEHVTYLVINDKILDYRNIGRENSDKKKSAENWINQNPEHNIATWGGVATQNNEDNQNTHFIGHNPGVFRDLTSLRLNDVISVYDNINDMRNYIVSEIAMIDDEGNLINQENVNIYEKIVGAGNEERITLQACLSDVTNIVVIAKADAEIERK